jgi:hypoxanthine-DNA glycosylase
MSHMHSFPPVITAGARVLILGSMPGRISLAQDRYYAHPRNAFWPLMGELFGAGPDLPYEQRLLHLQQRRIALWDVLKLCTREGSLDSAIVESSIVCNDFAQLFARHPGIRAVFFNGAKAESTWRRHVEPILPTLPLRYTRLPSTSPAHASLDHAAKRTAWSAVQRALDPPR